MANTLQIKRSTTAANTPTLDVGELGVNLTDRKLWVGGNGAGNIALGGDGLYLNRLDGRVRLGSKWGHFPETTGTVHYVDAANGNDSNSGTVGSPKATVTSAMSNATAGDTVVMYAGTYDMANYFLGGSNNITAAYSINTTFIAAEPGKVKWTNVEEFTTTTACTIKYYGIWFASSTGGWTHLTGNQGASSSIRYYYNCFFKGLSNSLSWGYDGQTHMFNCTVDDSFHPSYSNGSGTLQNTACTSAFTNAPGTHPTTGGAVTSNTNLPSISLGVDANISSSGWENTGTGRNPDGTRANIGVYGGPYAWTEYNTETFGNAPDAAFTNLVATGDLSAPNIIGKPDSYTKLLIHSDTTDGRKTFTDSSPNNITLVAADGPLSGDFPQHKTARSKFGSSSIYFDGNGDGIKHSAADCFNFGTSNYTIDFWHYQDSSDTQQAHATWFSTYNYGTPTGNLSAGIIVERNYGNNRYGVYVSSSSAHLDTGDAIIEDAWTHVAVVREGTGTNQCHFYVNGTEIFTFTDSTNYSSSNVVNVGWGHLYISESYGPYHEIKGYMDEMRLSSIARWTAAFTPPTRPYATFSAGDGVFTGELVAPRIAGDTTLLGSLGIGTAPGKELDVAGEGRFTGDVQIGFGGSTPDLIFGEGDSSIIGPLNANFLIKSRGNDAAEGISIHGADGKGMEVEKNGVATFSGRYARFKDGSTIGGLIGTGSSLSAAGAGDLAIRSSGLLEFITNDAWSTPRLTISAAGVSTFSGALTGTTAAFIDDGSLTQHLLHLKGGGNSGNYGMLVEANNGDDLFKIDALTYKVSMPSGYGVDITGALDVTTDIDCRDISPRDIIGADDIDASTLALTGALTGTTAAFSGNVSGDTFILPAAASAANQWIYTNNTHTGTGSLIIQAGAGSAGYGGGLRMYSHAHASSPGWVRAGISSGSGGKFAVNAHGIGTGADVFTVDASGVTTISGALSGTTAAFSGNIVVTKSAAAALQLNWTSNSNWLVQADNNPTAGSLIFYDIAASSYRLSIDNAGVLKPAFGLAVTGTGSFTGAVTWSGGGSANANTAYTYSQVGHLPLAGGTLTGGLTGTSATFSGTATATKFRATSQIVSADNMFMAAGQFYLGAEDGNTDDTYRMYGYSAGKFILQTRKSGTWTTRFEISSAGAATFSGAITATGITIGSNDVATESYCDTYTDQAIALLVDSSPATLNTLNELAAALGDDANYAATITTALGLKAPLASPALTGTATFGQLHGTSSTSEIGSGSSTAAIKRIRMHQGGELCFGDVTNANFLGLTEGTVNQFVDTDRLGLYYRNELKLYSNSNTLRVTWDVNGNQTNVGSLTAAGVTSSSNIRFSSGTVGNSTDPGITSSNTNAGIYFASSGVGLGSGSSSKYLFLDSSGNVSTGGTLTAVGDITVTGAGDVNATHLKLNNTGYIQLGTSWANERSLQIKGGPTIGATWNPVDGWTTHGGGFNVTKGSIGWTGTTDAYDFQVRRGGSAKLTATSAGATITGDLNVTTDIDCRDISPRDIIGADDIGASTLTLTGYLGGEVSRLINRGSNTAAKYPLGHYTPGEAVFEVDPTWSNAELQDFFGSGNVSFSNDSTAPGGYSIYINGATNVGAHYGSGFPHIPVDQDDIYYMECWVKGVGSVNHYMGSIDMKEDFGITPGGWGNPGTYGYFVMSNHQTTTSWVKKSAYIGGFGSSAGEFETGAKYFTPMALFNYTHQSGTRALYISGWKVIKVKHHGNRTFSGTLTAAGALTVGGDLTLSKATPQIIFTDTLTDPDKTWAVKVNANSFYITESGVADRLTIAAGGAVTWSGGGSANANTAYTYSQVGHLPLTAKAADSNLLDGVDSSSFMRSDTADSFTVIPTFAAGATGNLASRTGFTGFLGYNASYGSFIGGGAGNASTWLYAGGYFWDGSSAQTLYHTGNDGAGSGLDADLIDGLHLSQLDSRYHLASVSFLGLTSTAAEAYGLDIEDTRTVDDATGGGRNPNAMPDKQVSAEFTSQLDLSSDWHSLINVKGWADSYQSWQLISGSSTNTNEALYFRVGRAAAWTTHRTVWHSGSDGAGSGLDADFLDGQHGSYYLSTTGKAADSSLLDGIALSGLDNRYHLASTSFLTDSNDRFYITDTRSADRAPSYYDDRYVQADFNQSANFGVSGGDSWGTALTVAKWSAYDNSHRQEQLIFAGTKLCRRVATSDSAWSSTHTIWDSSTDGAGSGLDADLIDGLHLSGLDARYHLASVSFAPLASPSFTGTVQINTTPKLALGTGAELTFGDSTNANFIGITEGTVNQWTDTDRLGIYYRNELKLYANSNALKVTWASNGNQTLAGSLFCYDITSDDIDCRDISPRDIIGADDIDCSTVTTTGTLTSAGHVEFNSTFHMDVNSAGSDANFLMHNSNNSHLNFYSGNSSGGHSGSNGGNTLIDFRKTRDFLIGASDSTGLQNRVNYLTIAGNTGAATFSGALTANGATAHTRSIPNRWFGTADADNGIDSYSHLYAKAHFGGTYKYTTSRPVVTADSNYWVGTMGWGSTNFDTLFGYGSGSIDSWSTPTNAPSGTTHWVGSQHLHYHNGSVGYGTQRVSGAGLPSLTFIRGAWGGAFTSWYKDWNAANDGASSGLDADLLDGQQGSYYDQTASANFSGSGFVSRNSGNAIAIDSVTSNMVGYVNTSTAAGYSDGAGFSAAYSASWVGQLFVDFRSGKVSSRGKNNGTWQAHRFMWDNLNDGAGSGLDADLFDGLDSTAFLRGDADDQCYRRMVFQNCDWDNQDTMATASGSQGGIEIYNNGVGNDAFMAFHAGGDFAFYFGLDADNNSLSVGGWSYGANKYKVWNAYNDGSGSGLDADLIDGLHLSQLDSRYLSASTGWQNASNLNSGTVATARLGSGTANSSTYLRGDGTWAAVSGGGSGDIEGVTAGTGLSGGGTSGTVTVDLDTSGSDSMVNVHTALTTPAIDDYMIVTDESVSNDPIRKCKIRYLPLAKSSTFSASGCGGTLYMHNPNGTQQDSTSISLTCSGGGGS